MICTPTRLVGIMASLAISAELVGGCAGDSDPEADPPPPPASEPAATSAQTESEQADRLPVEVSVQDAGGETLEAKPFADFMVASGAGIWVTGVAPGVVRYDARTGEITARIRFDSPVVQALAATGGQVYAAGLEPAALLRIDATTGRTLSTTPLPATPLPESSIAADGSTAWVLIDDAGTTMLQVVEDGKATRTLPAPENSSAARFGFGSLWVTVVDGELVRMDPDTGKEIDRLTVGYGAGFLAVGEGAVWVLNAFDGSVSRVDPQSGEVVDILVTESAINGGDIATGLGAAWARTNSGVTRIDAKTGEATHRISIPVPGSGSVAAAAGWLWLTDHDQNAVHRVPWPPQPE